MRWLVGVVSAIVVLGMSPGANAAETPLYLGTVSGAVRVEGDPGPPCGMDEHEQFSYSASLASFQGPRDPFAIVSGSGSMIEGQGARGYAETGSGTYVLDPCDEIQSPGCSTGLQRRDDGSYGQVLFDVEGQTVKATALSFGMGPTSNACGGIGGGGTIGAGSFPLSMVGAQTITVSLTQHTSNGIYTWDGSGTLTLHRVDTVLKGDELAAPHATLLGTDVWRATLHNPRATAKSYRWEMKPSSGGGWTTLDTTKSSTYKITYRLAGNFKLRVWFIGASAGGPPKDLVSPVRPVEVRFPSWDDIVADKEVAKFTRAAWAHTLVLATRKWRQEVGFWISLRTCSGTYGHTTRIEGPRAGPKDRARIILGPRPADTTSKPDPVKGCYTYMVAAFHTHTPTTFLSRGRKVGPSPEDRQVNIGRKMPAVILDYIASPPGSGHIPAGWPKPKPAKPYWAGFFRRPTP